MTHQRLELSTSSVYEFCREMSSDSHIYVNVVPMPFDSCASAPVSVDILGDIAAREWARRIIILRVGTPPEREFGE